MDVTFTHDEAALLEHALTEYMTDLRSEIVGTDNFAMRKGLRSKEEALRNVLLKLKVELHT